MDGAYATRDAVAGEVVCVASDFAEDPGAFRVGRSSEPNCVLAEDPETGEALPDGVEGDRLSLGVAELLPRDASFLRRDPVRLGLAAVGKGAGAPFGRRGRCHAVRAARRRFPPAEAALRSVLRRFARDA